jgi:hypothetical protein
LLYRRTLPQVRQKKPAPRKSESKIIFYHVLQAPASAEPGIAIRILHPSVKETQKPLSCLLKEKD